MPVQVVPYYILFAQSDYERDSLYILIQKIDEIVLGLHNRAQEQIKIIFHTTSINCNIWT